jgi:glycogen synthase
MNLLFATTEFTSEKNFDGGLSNYLNRVTQAFKNRGHLVSVVVISDREEMIDFQGITVYRVKQPNTLHRFLNILTLKLLSKPILWLLQSLAVSKKINKIAKEQEIDIIQYASYKAIGFFRHKKITSLVRISSIELLWRKELGHKIRLKDRVLNFLEMRAIAKSDKVFGPSRLLASKVEQYIGTKVDVVVTPFELLNISYDTSVLDTLSKAKYLLFFGSVNRLKGIDLIASILEEVLAIDPELHFVFVGKEAKIDGMKSYQMIKEGAGEFLSRVHIFEPLQHSQLYPIVKAAEAVVLPSRIDNLPNTALESMGLSQIVIGARGASFDEIIEDNVNGLLFDKEDTNMLRESITKVIQMSEDKHQALKEGAFERSKAYSPDTVVKTLEKYYASNK